MILYVIRHGQTHWNAAGRLQGQTDTVLNEKGRRQARRNGQVLAARIGHGRGFDFVSSPLGRACETMTILRRALGLPDQGFATDPRLAEIHFGHWQGESWNSLRAAGQGAAIKARQANPWTFTPPGGESYKALSVRVLDWFNSLSGPMVVTTHGGILRVLQGALTGQNERDIPALPIPQDRILYIENGTINWL